MLRRVLTAGLCLFLFGGWARSAEKTDKPNIVLILADDLGAADTALGGSTFHRTPNLERLAERGMLFTNAYSASPLCSPTRASIMTGQSPARCGITSPGCHLAQEIFKASVRTKTKANSRQLITQSATRLSTDHYTLAEALKDAGYATAHFGKWHLGREPYSALEHGFDVDIPHWPGPGPAGSFVAPWKFPSFKERYPNEHIEDRMGDEVVAFMERQKDEPFFVNYWQFSVHAPFNAKADLIEAYRNRVDPKNPQQSPTYAAMIHSMDDNVGKILDAIDRLGIAENTIVIFYSDNGGNMYNLVDGTTATSNAPFRGGKATMYEGGVRVPALFVWPGVVPRGARCEALIQSEDLYATILEMVGLSPQPEQSLDSISAVPALRGKPGLRDAVYTFFPHSPAVPDFLPPSAAVRRGDWKLIRIFHDSPDQSHRHELYNLKDDIGERRNLAAQHAERVRQMDALIGTFLKRTNAVLPRPNPRYNPDISEEYAGWRSAGYVHLRRTDAGLQIRSYGEDPMTIETSEKLSLRPDRHVLEIRMRSLSASGRAQVLWKGDGEAFDQQRSADFVVVDDGLWHEHGLQLPFSKTVSTLRISPVSTQGVVHIDWIRLRDFRGVIVEEWKYRKK
jgi:arylsulfatase A-like enzyme